MTHDEDYRFDPKYCSMCKLQAEARDDERKKISQINFSTPLVVEAMQPWKERVIYGVLALLGYRKEHFMLLSIHYDKQEKEPDN